IQTCDAVELCFNSNKTIKAVAENLGTSSYNLSKWKRDYSNKGDLSFPGKGKQELTPEQEEVHRLKKPRETQTERDILKKAVAIFSKKPK
ncbi:MAG: transposase, partial [Halanaerobiales bacterium]|nr:transposase [Halanaerobiales bacterium]